ncbi:O-acetyl-ADP-ribose deacetylase macrod2 [Coemansia helicoidea]|uniref:O-acetyl-ADP-ribose deacetylase macrod2 n=1 Tax=Coemansia helicoidea TaxID=1286919 RepID=A0ACC1KWJ8_9FUNG|nr:O-acetyl-ADP-ribose deacetylase macrod2 [Coemansia helicoidea]
MAAVAVSEIRTAAEQLGALRARDAFLAAVSVWQGDITRLQVDAIVNAADEAVLGGGGVDGAIHRAAGPRLLAACRALGGCRTGHAKLTAGFKLPAKNVIHAVGPVGEQPALLASAYRESLEVAWAHGLRTVAFSCISTGTFGYPKAAACAVAVETVRAWLGENAGVLDRVIFCVFDRASADVYWARLGQC